MAMCIATEGIFRFGNMDFIFQFVVNVTNDQTLVRGGVSLVRCYLFLNADWV
jgi:hypothetical protein